MPDRFISRVRLLFGVAIFSLLSIGFFFRLPTNILAVHLPGDLWVYGPTGVDVGDCTDKFNPCASTQYASDQTIPGDTVNVYAIGTYTGDITITNGGNVTTPIFYQPWPGTGIVNIIGTVTIQGAYIRISAFDITGGASGFGLVVNDTDHVLLENLIIHDVNFPIALRGALGDLYILNNTLYANAAGSSAGIILDPAVVFTGSNPITIENNIIANALFGIATQTVSFPPLGVYDYNSFWNNTADYDNLTPAANDITTNPLFISPAGGNFNVSSSSPDIDAGVDPGPGPGGGSIVPIDINGVSRPQGAGYDIGPYEYVPPSSSSGLSSAGAPSSCSNSAPTGTISLYKIATTKTAAKLYFTPIKDATSYQIFFGYKAGDTRFAGTFPSHSLPYTIDHLNPNTTYYFAVRGENNCAGGNISNWLSATTGGSSQTSTSLSGSPPSPTPIVSTVTPSPTPTPTPTAIPTNQSFGFFSSIINFFKQLFHL